MIKRALVIVNPGSGSASRRRIGDALERQAGSLEWRVRWLEEGEDAEQVARKELREGWDVVVAAGGDGTVARVARAAGEAGVALAIVPMGTANMLAEQLGIPANIDAAIGLLTGDTAIRQIDGMEVDGRLYFLSAGVGISAATIRDLSDANKRRFGVSSYILMGIASSFTFRPVPCALSMDGHSRRLRIFDVSVINAGFNAERAVPGMPDVRPDDGRLDVLIAWAPSPPEYLRHLWRALLRWRRVTPNVQWRVAEREIDINCSEPIPVQADGDIVATTPVTIRLVRGAVGVVVPAHPR